jgi:hypothetical protein
MPMIKAYTQYLRQKLDYHNLRPFFSGTFDYEEFVSLKGVQDPNEGYLFVVMEGHASNSSFLSSSRSVSRLLANCLDC